MIIKDVHAREILDSRGIPTIEVSMALSNGIISKASIPSGASTGSKEALELRDGNLNRYHGKGVLKAVRNVNEIIKPALVGMKLNQIEVDKILLKLDGTENKTKLGANAMLGVSLATLKCLAKLENKELYELLAGNKATMPLLMVNIINGGKHASNGLKIQEFMIIPIVKTIAERIRVSSEIFHTLKNVLEDSGYNTAVGDEGGYAPGLKNSQEALNLIIKAIEISGYQPGKNVFIALDCAASEFYDKDTKHYTIDNSKLTGDELIKYYLALVNEYPIISIEDPLDENDYESLAVLTKLLGNKVMIVGDDYFASNCYYLNEGIIKNAGNSILLKPNQIGTITEFSKTIGLAKKNNYKTIMSHRSGETTDTFLADLAVGFNSDFIKTGSMSRGERICKYNRLMEIEEKLTK